MRRLVDESQQISVLRVGVEITAKRTIVENHQSIGVEVVVAADFEPGVLTVEAP